MKNSCKEEIIRNVFLDLGFVLAGFISREKAALGNWIEPWLEKGFHADMSWLEKHAEIRSDPCSIEDYGKSFILLAYPYLTTTPDYWGSKNPISKYAWGRDYHKVLKKKLNRGIETIKQDIPDFAGRPFVDSAPIPEKILASLAGLGWIGKNSLLINQFQGSYIFLCEIVTNQNLQPTLPTKDLCGTCTRCIDACPTDAIVANQTIDSNLCLSWLTIEKKGPFDASQEKLSDYQLFGCDICQEVCPWNLKITSQTDSPFECFDRWSKMKIEDFEKMDENQYNELKVNSPLKRAKLEGLKRNAKALLKETKNQQR